MSHDLAAFFPGKEDSAQALLACNGETQRYGLGLTRDQALELCLTRDRALKVTGRVEFGSGILARLARAFAPSPWIAPQDWPDTLGELMELFYSAKTESADLLTDGQLLDFMVRRFDVPCRGSLAALEDLVYALARRARGGEVPEDA